MSTEEDATTQIQAALGTQDPSYIKSALSYYGETLRRGSSQARADLEVAEGYLEQLEAFAAAFFTGLATGVIISYVFSSTPLE